MATIQGYVYQVGLTIAQWLDLEAGSILELERGKDINVVSQAITNHKRRRARAIA